MNDERRKRLGNLIQLRSFGAPGVILRAEFQSESIASKSWKNMEVNMEDLLHGGFTVSEEEVHSFTGQATRPQSGGGGVTDPHKIGGCIRI